MNKFLNQIIINLSILMFLGGCHTSEHRQLFYEYKIKNIVTKDVKLKIIPTKKDVKLKITQKKRNLQSLINFSETELYSKIGKGNFIKKEGQLKNIQYYFSKCFLDIFLIKKNSGYQVTFLQIRSTILNGSINKDDCLNEISSKLKTNFN